MNFRLTRNCIRTLAMILAFLPAWTAEAQTVTVDSIWVLNTTINECDSVYIRIKGNTTYMPAQLDSFDLLDNGSDLTLDAHFAVGMLAALDNYDVTMAIGPFQTGTYNLNTRVYSGGTTQDSISVSFSVSEGTINDGLFNEPFAIPDTSVCPNGTLQLDAGNPGQSYLWSNGATTQSVLVDQPGWYWVEVRDQFCNKTEDSIYVNINNVAPLDLGPQQNICVSQRESVDLSASGWTSYLWLPGGETSSTITVDQEGMVYLQATNDAGCVATDSVMVNSFCPPLVFVPNAFSPNDDGHNDSFVPTVVDVTSFQLRIFNRWGQLIYESNDPTNGWNGEWRGRKAPAGNYAWIMTYSNGFDPSADGGTRVASGAVTLIR